jgi:hypothetical protein
VHTLQPRLGPGRPRTALAPSREGSMTTVTGTVSKFPTRVSSESARRATEVSRWSTRNHWQNLKAGPPLRVTVKRGASESRPWRPWPPSAGPGPPGYYLHDASCLRSTRLNMFSGLQYSFLQFNFMSRNVLLLEYLEFSSVVECAFSGGFTTPSLNCEGFSFCWIGFCARDDFKHSEVKWRLLHWQVLRESLTTCRLALQCTRVERYFAKVQTLH